MLIVCDCIGALVTMLKEYYSTYPAIKPLAVCSYYRTLNKVVPTFFLAFIMGVLAIELFTLAMFILWQEFSVCSFYVLVAFIVNILFFSLHFYLRLLLQQTSTPKTVRRDLAVQQRLRRRFLVLGYVPAFVLVVAIHTLIPVLGDDTETADICWLIHTLLQLSLATWFAGGFLHKVLAMFISNTVFCAAAISKGYFTRGLGFRFVVPVLVAMAFFMPLMKAVRENFLLKHAIKQQRDMYHEFLQQFRASILIFSGTGTLLFKNQSAETQLGVVTAADFFEKAKNIRTTHGSSIAQDVLAKIQNRAEECAKIPARQRCFIATAPTPAAESPEPRQKVLTAVIVRSDVARGPTVSVMLNEITDEVAIEEERAEEKYKNILLFSLSHELKTPLNIFQCFLHETKRCHEEHKTDECVRQNAKGAWRYLMNKINDILDYAQMLSSEFALHKCRFSLKRLLHYMKKTTFFLLMGKRERIKLEFELDPDISDEFEGDRERIEQVLFNLLSNAVRFTEAGTISLRIFMANRQLLAFEVSDTGCGMTKDTSQLLFSIASPSLRVAELAERRKKCGGKNFRRIGKATGLSGLGLTVSHMICARMGADITVESEVEKGSVFSFTLFHEQAMEFVSSFLSDFSVPDENAKVNKCATGTMAGQVPKPLAREPSRSYRSRSALKKSICGNGTGTALIVDDNDFNRMVAEQMIHKFGLRTVMAENGRAALDKLGEIQTERAATTEGEILVFMDLDMPIMDGIEATIEMRKRVRSPRPYIVALTAFSSEDERLKCFEAGMDSFLSKPLTKEKLHDLFYNLRVIP